MHPLRSIALLLLAAPLAAQNPAPFDAATVMAGDEERFVKTADLDGDGFVEAVGWWRVGTDPSGEFIHRLSGYHNDHTGKLARVWTVEFTALANLWGFSFDPHECCEVADLDGDGDDDFVISTGTRIDVWISNGVLPPTLAVSAVAPSPSVWKSIVLADFDLDGDLDIAAIRGASVQIYDIDLANGVLALRSGAGGAWTSGRLLAVDVNGDGTPDIVNDGRILYPVVNSQIGVPVTYPFPWPQESGYELRHDAGDIDGDGDIDIVTFRVHISLPLNSYSILRRTGPASFVREGPYSGGPARQLFDVDGDGDLDGICCGGGGGGIPKNILPSSFRIAVNDGTGTFAPALEIFGLGSSAIAGAADLDHDGRMDLVAGRCVYFQRHDLPAVPQPVVASRELLDNLLVDVDADGDIDLEVLPGSLRVNRGDGQVQFGALTLPTPPAGTTRSGEGYVADWDGDGDADLLVNLNTGANAQIGLELLRNSSSGVFTSVGQVSSDMAGYPFAQTADDYVCADVDGDGDLDLVKRNLSLINIGVRSAWWSNDGASFTRREVFEGYLVLEVADFDGDSIPDLLAGSGTTSNFTLWIAHGLGGGSFGTWQSAASANIKRSYHAVASADLDGDGDRDIVVVHYFPAVTLPRLEVLWNQGASVFTPELITEFLGQSTKNSVRVFDVDEDGVLDIVAGPAASSALAVAIHRGLPGGGFEAPVQQMLLYAPYPMITPTYPQFGAADIDGDGDIDLVTNRLLQNNHHHDGLRGLHVQTGTGTPGEGGVRPLLGAEGPFRVGEEVSLVLRGAPPGATGVLTTGFTDGIPAANLGPGVAQSTAILIHSRISIVATGNPGDEVGSGTWELPYTVPPYVVGRTKYYSVTLNDPTALSGTTRSNGVYVTYGP